MSIRHEREEQGAWGVMSWFTECSFSLANPDELYEVDFAITKFHTYVRMTSAPRGYYILMPQASTSRDIDFVKNSLQPYFSLGLHGNLVGELSLIGQSLTEIDDDICSATNLRVNSILSFLFLTGTTIRQ